VIPNSPVVDQISVFENGIGLRPLPVPVNPRVRENVRLAANAADLPMAKLRVNRPLDLNRLLEVILDVILKRFVIENTWPVREIRKVAVRVFDKLKVADRAKLADLGNCLDFVNLLDVLNVSSVIENSSVLTNTLRGVGEKPMLAEKVRVRAKTD
jgi:hypothetical protein